MPQKPNCARREIVPDMRQPSGQRQERWDRDQHKIDENDRPLAALNCAPMARLPHRVEPAGERRRGGSRQGGQFAHASPRPPQACASDGRVYPAHSKFVRRGVLTKQAYGHCWLCWGRLAALYFWLFVLLARDIVPFFGRSKLRGPDFVIAAWAGVALISWFLTFWLFGVHPSLNFPWDPREGVGGGYAGKDCLPPPARYPPCRQSLCQSRAGGF